MAIQRLAHVGLCVSDLEASRSFYRDALGMREVHHLEVSGGSASTLLELEQVELSAVFLERDGFRLELLCYRSPGHVGDAMPAPMNRLGLTHVSMRVDDLDATVEVLRRAGVEVLDDTRTSNPQFSAAAIFVVDPDGTRIELVQAPGDPALPPGL